ncbi:MAG: hypothetical protein ABIT37_20175 [Luteolibacter sp.]
MAGSYRGGERISLRFCRISSLPLPLIDWIDAPFSAATEVKRERFVCGKILHIIKNERLSPAFDSVKHCLDALSGFANGGVFENATENRAFGDKRMAECDKFHLFKNFQNQTIHGVKPYL